MKLLFEKRPQPSRVMTVVSPVLAILLMVIVGAILFAARGIDPWRGLYVYFIEPVTTLWSIEELVVKATPLVLIGVGLAVCFRANVWNIGAEGQFTLGAIAGAAIPILAHQWQSPLVLPLMMLLGMAGGIAWAAISGAAAQSLRRQRDTHQSDARVRGAAAARLAGARPVARSGGLQFPRVGGAAGSATPAHAGLQPGAPGRRIRGAGGAGAVPVHGAHRKGFEIEVSGAAPRASGFGGFSRPRTVWFCLALSGALAGLAGIGEIAGPVGQLQPVISPGYGFTAIIVAFLGG